MLDLAISEFFDDRKAAWLKKKINTSMEENEVKELKMECENLFSLEEWLPNAAKRAGQISLATHPCTFSHPSARKNKNGYVSSVISQAMHASDGYLRTGNVVVDVDALGNAAALDVYKFLTLEMEDGRSLLSHIEQGTELSVNLLKIQSKPYQVLREGFLEMSETSGESVTSSKIKQVFFPVEEDYHQLSLLSNSGLIYQLRKRVDNMRFSDESKALREIKRKGNFSAQGFTEIYNLTTIGYGGTKPQNISVMNNSNGGKAQLLQSLPPVIEKRNIHFPKINFFNESLHYYDCRESFQALHKILKTEYNNIKIREGRDYRLQEIMDLVIEKMWAIRSIAQEQYHADSSRLKKHQLIWLVDEFSQEREESDQWLDKLCKELSVWIVRAYEQAIGRQAIKLGEAERIKIVDLIDLNREGLR
ncbi:MAG: type I-F CRISPR-associated protein Csy1 [Pseudomonadales bacterium]|nr:type I-F CRISPR-associated protein Csy1 [Pseudomonadales bacterium]